MEERDRKGFEKEDILLPIFSSHSFFFFLLSPFLFLLMFYEKREKEKEGLEERKMEEKKREWIHPLYSPSLHFNFFFFFTLFSFPPLSNKT
jgi:hypothetical protein